MADPVRGGNVPNFAHPFLAALKTTSNMQNAYRLDEGYSEDTRSQAGSEMRADSRMGETSDNEPAQILPDWVSSMTEYERSGASHRILNAARRFPDKSGVLSTVDGALFPLATP